MLLLQSGADISTSISRATRFQEVSEQRSGHERRLIVTSPRSGDLVRTFTVDGDAAAFDDEVRDWMRGILDHFPRDFFLQDS